MYCDPNQEAVRAFHEAMELPAPDAPTELDYPQAVLRADLIHEEAHEVEDALFVACTAADLEGWAHVAHELADVLVVVYGTAVSMGIDLKPFFDEVMAANMRKVGGERRADGKVLKPEGWKPADTVRVWRHLYGEDIA